MHTLTEIKQEIDQLTQRNDRIFNAMHRLIPMRQMELKKEARANNDRLAELNKMLDNILKKIT